MQVAFPMVYENVHREQMLEISKNTKMCLELRQNNEFMYKVIEGYELIMKNKKFSSILFC